jgi:hypothetical protein
VNTFWSLLTLISIFTPAFARVRKVEVPQDKIVTVRTALGIATIIQVPAPPTSLVVGDSSAFKVEYLDQAITIKPLRANAKSNLYVYTDWRRFNVQLVTGGEGAADYVVYLEEPIPKSKAPSLRWTSVNRSLQSEGVSIAVHRTARTRDGRLLIEFAITATKPAIFDPRWVWITQRGKPRPIQSLFLSNLNLSPSGAATGTLELLPSEVDPHEPLHLELRNKATATLLLPRVSAWK